MDEQNVPLSVTLSLEEVALLVRLFGAKTMPGMGTEPLAGIPPDQVNFLLSSADRSLRARRIISLSEDGKITIERFILALLGPCIAPEFSVVSLCAKQGGAADMVYFHAAQMMTVEHVISGPGLHTFAALKDRQMLFNRLISFVSLDGQPLRSAPTGQLTAETTEAAMKSIVKGASAVLAVLKAGGADNGFAQAFSNDLAKLDVAASVTAIQHTPDGQATMQHYTFLTCGQTLWEYYEVGPADSPKLEFKPVSAGTAKNRIWKMVVG
jgi:hypothetical protein